MAWWRSGYGVGHATPKVTGSTLGLALSGNNLGQVVHTHVPLSPRSIISTGQGAVMPCSWEGNRRSGVTLAVRHRLNWFIHLWAHGLDREISTPPTLLMGYGTLYLFIAPPLDHFWAICAMQAWYVAGSVWPNLGLTTAQFNFC